MTPLVWVVVLLCFCLLALAFWALVPDEPAGEEAGSPTLNTRGDDD